LDGHVACDAGTARLVHLTPPSFADRLKDLVQAELLSG
jgi:hypothetical protein